MEWKQYDTYHISEYGDILNKHGKQMKLDVTYKGYRKVVLIHKKWYVHRLVATLWLDNPLNKPQVNHKDMDKLNNHYSNLEWCTNIENALHASIIKGDKHITTKSQYDLVVQYTSEGKTPKEIVELLGMNRNTVVGIRQGYNNKRFIKTI